MIPVTTPSTPASSARPHSISSHATLNILKKHTSWPSWLISKPRPSNESRSFWYSPTSTGFHLASRKMYSVGKLSTGFTPCRDLSTKASPTRFHSPVRITREWVQQVPTSHNHRERHLKVKAPPPKVYPHYLSFIASFLLMHSLGTELVRCESAW